MESIHKTGTLCWECANATGNCSWSSKLVPVEGWVAKPVKKKDGLDSFCVYICPKFERDAYDMGLTRVGKE